MWKSQGAHLRTKGVASVAKDVTWEMSPTALRGTSTLSGQCPKRVSWTRRFVSYTLFWCIQFLSSMLRSRVPGVFPRDVTCFPELPGIWEELLFPLSRRSAAVWSMAFNAWGSHLSFTALTTFLEWAMHFLIQSSVMVKICGSSFPIDK